MSAPISLAVLRRCYPHAAAAICNGVGPKFAQLLFRHLWRRWEGWEPNAEFFTVACEHDFAYWCGGGLLDKWAADAQFIGGCMGIAVRHTGWRKLALVIVAQMYGLAVKSVLGWLAWSFRRRGTQELVILEFSERKRRLANGTKLL